MSPCTYTCLSFPYSGLPLIIITFYFSVRSPPTLDNEVRCATEDPYLPHETACNKYAQRGQSCRLSRKRGSNTIQKGRPRTSLAEHVANLQKQRRQLLTPISVHPNVEDHLAPTQVVSASYTAIKDTLEPLPQQQNALPRSGVSSHSSPILDLPSTSNSPSHYQQSSSELKSFSTPWMVDNHSASEISLGSVVAKTHRHLRKKKQ